MTEQTVFIVLRSFFEYKTNVYQLFILQNHLGLSATDRIFNLICQPFRPHCYYLFDFPTITGWAELCRAFSPNAYRITKT